MCAHSTLRLFVLTLTLALTTSSTATSLSQEEPTPWEFADEALGVKLTLPDARWKKTDHSQGNAKVFVFSPDANLKTRCSVLHMPKAFLPDGIMTRDKQLQLTLKDTYKRVSLDNVQFCEREARRLEYTLANSKTIEWELEDGDAYLIFQLATGKDSWNNPDESQRLNDIRDSLEFTGATKKTATKASVATVKEIRAARKELVSVAEPRFQLRHHELHVDLKPAQHSLHVRDRVTLRALADNVNELTLYVSEVTVQEVACDADFTWQIRQREGGKFEDANLEELQLSFAKALPKGEDVIVDVVAHSDDFLHEIDQQLVAEIAVLGQVRERSSFSSHVIYYPVDGRKDGSMDMTLTVPAGMTAVTGGRLVSSKTEGDRSVFRYQMDDRRPRLLPFGFAAGNYIHRSGQSDGGLNLAFYGYSGDEKLLDQRVEAGVEAANVFEKLMGPLPWSNVNFAHVTPVRKETGVSLPGLILISDGFFTDFEDVDVSDGNLADRNTLSLLVVADELSHQWNAYAVPLPNQLAEGVSTFTNVLFIEQRAGRQASDNAIRFCRDAYFMSSGLGDDVAIADPAIYHTAAYRGIAFTKTAVVLAMLRELVGDDIFYAGWREAFQEFEANQDGFQVVEDAFASTANQDLKWFFDQWFYRPSWAKLKVTHQQNGHNLTVALEQQQSGDPFRMPVRLVARGADGQTHSFTAQLESRKTTVATDCSFHVETILIDANEIGLVQIVDK